MDTRRGARRDSVSVRRILVVALILGACVAGGLAQDATVSLTKMLQETQRFSEDPSELTVVWWIPEDYWQITMARDGSMTEAGIEELVQKPPVPVEQLGRAGGCAGDQRVRRRQAGKQPPVETEGNQRHKDEQQQYRATEARQSSDHLSISFRTEGSRYMIIIEHPGRMCWTGERLAAHTTSTQGLWSGNAR